MSASASVPATAHVYQPLTKATPEQTSGSASKSESRHSESRHRDLVGSTVDWAFKTWLTDPSVFALR
jgi:hypothetical protein